MSELYHTLAEYSVTKNSCSGWDMYNYYWVIPKNWASYQWLICVLADLQDEHIDCPQFSISRLAKINLIMSIFTRLVKRAIIIALTHELNFQLIHQYKFYLQLSNLGFRWEW